MHHSPPISHKFSEQQRAADLLELRVDDGVVIELAALGRVRVVKALAVGQELVGARCVGARWGGMGERGVRRQAWKRAASAPAGMAGGARSTGRGAAPPGRRAAAAQVRKGAML